MSGVESASAPLAVFTRGYNRKGATSMNDDKKIRRVTFAVIAAVILASVLLFALFAKPLPELPLDRAALPAMQQVSEISTM